MMRSEKQKVQPPSKFAKGKTNPVLLEGLSIKKQPIKKI